VGRVVQIVGHLPILAKLAKLATFGIALNRSERIDV
jgi:hypothetical protein